MISATRQARSWIFALRAVYLGSCLWACTAQLDNPEAFSNRAPPESGASASAAAAAGAAAAGGSSSGGESTFAGVGGGAAGMGGAAAGNGGSSASAGNAGTSAGGTTGGVPACVAALFVNGSGKCTSAACHAKGSSPSASLDLGSPNVTARLVDQLATHTGLDASSTCPKGDKLIDSANPSQSWMLKKIMGQQGSCGVRMPFGLTLTSTELTCLQIWIQSF